MPNPIASHSRRHSWFEQHKSIFFLVGLAVVSLGFMIVGQVLSSIEGAYVHAFAAVLFQVGSVGIAAGTVTVFLGFRDVRDHFTALMSQMVFEGDFGRAMDRKTQQELRRRLTCNTLSPDVRQVNEGLYEHLQKLTDRCLSSVIMYNYHANIVLSPIAGDEEHALTSTVRTFRLDASNHVNGADKIKYRYTFAIPRLDGSNSKLEDTLQKFSVRIDKVAYGISDLVTEAVMFGSYPMLKCTFRAEVDIQGTADFRISLQSKRPLRDLTEISYVYYPCSGFSCTLMFVEGWSYDYAWFADWELDKAFLPMVSDIQTLHNGISVTTNDWLLPGHGVTLACYPPGKVMPKEQTTS